MEADQHTCFFALSIYFCIVPAIFSLSAYYQLLSYDFLFMMLELHCHCKITDPSLRNNSDLLLGLLKEE